jgi:hypothetical protein
MSAPFPEGPLRQAVRHLFNSDLASSQSVLANICAKPRTIRWRTR